MNAAEEKTSVCYVVGDATRPEGDGLKIIAHCCNDEGVWGAGFVLALSDRWKRPEVEYRRWTSNSIAKGKKLLGATQLVPVEDDIWVANIVGQRGLKKNAKGKPPVRYDALDYGFKIIAEYARTHPERRISVHLPRIGCGLAGGSWDQIEPLLRQHFVANDIPVTVYDLPGPR
jgi:O-acetyl-ADP-ribose deacetylase (regulator of RNase III)